MPAQKTQRRAKARPSLSDWYSRPKEDEDDDDNAETNELKKDAASTRESSIGKVTPPTSKPLSPILSPTRTLGQPVSFPVVPRLALHQLQQPNFFIGEDSDLASLPSARGTARGTARGNAESDIMVRGICACYFESHVSPLLRALQQAQEQVNTQLSDIKEQMSKKAETQHIAELVSKEVDQRLSESSTSMLERLQEMSTALDQKAQDDALRSLKEEVNALRRGCEEARIANSAASSDAEKSDVKKLQTVVAAAGVRFDKQLQELRLSVRDMQSKIGTATPTEGNLWPGRVLRSGPNSDAGSDAASQPASLTGSLAGSVRSVDPEASAEFKKMQAVVGAAGTVFYRDLQQLRKDVHDVREQMTNVKGVLAAGGAIGGALLKNSDFSDLERKLRKEN